MPNGDVIQVKYPVLFTVKILHHFFLDKGASLFDNIAGEEQTRLLAKYDNRRVLDIQPTPKTKEMLAGKKMLFKPHTLGFTVAAQGDASGAVDPAFKLGSSEKLLFTVKITDPYFLQYSAGFLKREPVKIEKAATIDERDKLFKKVFYLSNALAVQTPFLSRKPFPYDGAETYKPEAFVEQGGEFYQKSQLSAAGTAPAGVSDADWELLKKKGTLKIHYVTSADQDEKELTDELDEATFAVIEIQGGDSLGGFSLYDNTGKLLSPVFEIRFKNRSTWWRYFKLTAGQPALVTETALPLALTSSGRETVIHNSEQLPNPAGTHPINIDPLDTKERLLSDIYL